MCISSRIAGSIILAGLCLLSSPLWLSGAWGQNTPLPLVQSRPTAMQSPPGLSQSRPAPAKYHRAFALQPIPVQQAPAVAPIVFPVTAPSSALGTALAACETGAEASEFSLPGAKGEIKLDHCYRGRDHLVCHFNALTAEAKALLENYRKIVDENYPDVRDMGGICTIKPDILGNNLQNSTEFANRFKTLKAEYEARVNCTNRIEQSLTQVTLPDISQAQGLLKSMIDTIEGDVRAVTEVQGKLSEFADKMDSSQRAMATLQKVHRAMCMTSK